MPETTGCEKCIDINKENSEWCCLCQSPSMYYIEFLNVWQVYHRWSKKEKQNLILRAVRNYLDNNLNKGCIFFSDKCLCYKYRPYNCRMYGIIPSEEWNKRWELLKKRQSDKFNALPQCNLVSTTSGEMITSEKSDRWFAHTRKCEERIGVNKKTIALHDLDGGSYRTFHDHLLLYLMPDNVLEDLQILRFSDNEEEKIAAIEQFVFNFKKKLKNE